MAIHLHCFFAASMQTDCVVATYSKDRVARTEECICEHTWTFAMLNTVPISDELTQHVTLTSPMGVQHFIVIDRTTLLFVHSLHWL